MIKSETSICTWIPDPQIQTGVRRCAITFYPHVRTTSMGGVGDVQMEMKLASTLTHFLKVICLAVLLWLFKQWKEKNEVTKQLNTLLKKQEQRLIQVNLPQ